MRRNERKLQVLRLLAEGPKTPSELSAILGKSEDWVRATISRYVRQGLVRAERIQGGVVYMITDKGLQRLDYLERTMGARRWIPVATGTESF